MGAPNTNPSLVREMNDLLGRELGRNEYGDPIFSWRWSEDLFWPAFRTGEEKTVEKEVLLPIIGGGVEKSIMQSSEPVYSRDRQVHRTDTWYIAKWLKPWELILGPNAGHVRHGDQQSEHKAPSQEALVEAWNAQFPGADFPSRGWRVPTDAYLPNGPEDENWAASPHGNRDPNEKDTLRFIQQVKFQASRNFDEVLQDMLDREDTKNAKEEALIGDECADAFTAFLNPSPGKRNSFISMPWTKKDRL